MALMQEERPNGSCPFFGLFHTSLGSTVCIESEFQSDLTVENIPSSADMTVKVFHQKRSRKSLIRLINVVKTSASKLRCFLPMNIEY